MRKKPVILALLLTCLLSTQLSAQRVKVSNVFHRIINDKIEIFYDLPYNRDTVLVEIFFYKKSSPGFTYRPKYTSGHIGTAVFSGKKKKVVWNYRKEPPNLFTGKGFYFDVRVQKIHNHPK
jgi:hypothetical protein